MSLRIEHLTKHYRIAGKKKRVIDSVSLEVRPGEAVSITGKSGSGKTTLLNLIAGIAYPDSGAVYIRDRRVRYRLDLHSSKMRNREIGFIFQTFQLLHEETVLANVLLPARIKGRVTRDTREYADGILSRLKIYSLRNTKAALLSGGQKQRVAIARAMVNKPGIILADEPTANLDRETSIEIFNTLTDLRSEGKALLIVTHDDYMLARSDRVFVLERGTLGGAS